MDLAKCEPANLFFKGDGNLFFKGISKKTHCV